LFGAGFLALQLAASRPGRPGFRLRVMRGV